MEESSSVTCACFHWRSGGKANNGPKNRSGSSSGSLPRRRRKRSTNRGWARSYGASRASMMAGIRLSSPATHLNRSNELGAGEGNRTLDIQLGKVFDVSLFLLLFRLLMHPL